MSVRVRPTLRLLLIAWLFACLARPAAAQGIEVVHAFPAKPAVPWGHLLELSDGVFLGTSSAGGAYQQGSIYVLFRRADGTWDTIVVHSFSGQDGATPLAGLIRATDGNFYGTTRNGGAERRGTVFRMTPFGEVTVIHTFSETDGWYPEAALVQTPDGRLWGTTRGGSGVTAGGTVFALTLFGTFTRVRAFSSPAEGSNPHSLVVGPDGRLYGATEYGGNGGGTIFRMTTSGAFAVLRSFEPSGGPKYLRPGRDGRIYGAAYSGTPESPGGELLVITPATGAVGVFHVFEAAPVVHPTSAPVQAADGTLYGTADTVVGDPSTPGGVYRITASAGVEQVGALGGPLGIFSTGLVLASDGKLYGTTVTGERPLPPHWPHHGAGVAFSVDPSVPGVALLHSFSDETPSGPAGPLVEGPDAHLYGTSCYGGIYNRGTIFRIGAGGATTLHSFSGVDGLCPASGLMIGPDGAFYGTTFAGAFGEPATEGASVFRITADGEFRVLWEPNQNAPYRWALAAPTAGPDGQLYVPMANIFGGDGAILRLTTGGDVTMEQTFNVENRPGDWPAGRLLLGPDGDFYGTTSSATGGVFRMTTDGTLSTVHLFQNDSELGLRTGVILASDGRLYGAAMTDGSTGAGRAYAMTLDGEPSILHEFAFTDGAFPWGELLEIGPGQFLGLTHAFGQHQYGTMFTVGSDGSFATLHHFSWLDGANPFGGLMRKASGEIYGLTHRGGPLGGGVIFRVIQ